MLRPASFALLLVLAGCASRPLTEGETAFVDTIMAGEVEPGAVAVVKGSAVSIFPVTIPDRPRTTCRERLNPPRTGPQKGYYAAFVTGETIFYARRAWQDDFLADYPEAMDLREAMRLAHEMTHVWQWQNRATTGYHPVLAALEHVERDDPYLTEIDPSLRFRDYSWEQQGTLVEEFVCCRALDPDGGRTAQLHDLVREVFPGATATSDVPGIGVRLRHPVPEADRICA